MLPVRWRVLRDWGGATVVSSRGASGCSYPWGRVADAEYLRYEVGDAEPANARAHGEARTEIHLRDRLLSFTSVLDLGSDPESLHYRFRRELCRDGVLVRERTWDRRYRRDGH